MQILLTTTQWYNLTRYSLHLMDSSLLPIQIEQTNEKPHYLNQGSNVQTGCRSRHFIRSHLPKGGNLQKPKVRVELPSIIPCQFSADAVDNPPFVWLQVRRLTNVSKYSKKSKKFRLFTWLIWFRSGRKAYGNLAHNTVSQIVRHQNRNCKNKRIGMY